MLRTTAIAKELAAIERKLKETDNATLKEALKKKQARLKDELKDTGKSTTQLAKTLLAQREAVKALSKVEFNDLIRRLSKKPEYSFLKTMPKSTIKNDLEVTAKPVGWRFKGRGNYDKPTKAEIAKGKKNGTVYREVRPRRSDVSQVVRLEDGGGVKKYTVKKESGFVVIYENGERYGKLKTLYNWNKNMKRDMPYIAVIRFKDNKKFDTTFGFQQDVFKYIKDTGELPFTEDKMKHGGSMYAEGGSVDESVEMIEIQSKEAKHHADELANAIKGKKHIEPWVIAKMERATTDLSDITHYLDGKKEKMMHGGQIEKGSEISFRDVMGNVRTGEVIDVLSNNRGYEVRSGYGTALVKADEIIEKMETGGEVGYYTYKNVSIMFEPHFKEYYVGDAGPFNTLDEAKEYIDSGSQMPDSIKGAYEKGLFAQGGGITKSPRKKFLLYTNPNNSTNKAYVAIGQDVKDVLKDSKEYPGSYTILYQGTGTNEDLQKAKSMYSNYSFGNHEEIMAQGGKLTATQQKKFDKVMHEWGQGKLHSGKNGPIVTDQDQALAIAYAEANASKMAQGGGVGDCTGAYTMFYDFVEMSNEDYIQDANIVPYLEMNGVIVRYTEGKKKVAVIVYNPRMEKLPVASVVSKVMPMFPKNVQTNISSFASKFNMNSPKLCSATLIKIVNHNGELMEEFEEFGQGGELKPIPSGNKGLSKLPKAVRNKMGFMKEGGSMYGWKHKSK